jgi:hypothetical protein
MRRVAAIEAKLAGVFPDHAIDRVGILAALTIRARLAVAHA